MRCLSTNRERWYQRPFSMPSARAKRFVHSLDSPKKPRQILRSFRWGEHEGKVSPLLGKQVHFLFAAGEGAKGLDNRSFPARTGRAKPAVSQALQTALLAYAAERVRLPRVPFRSVPFRSVPYRSVPFRSISTDGRKKEIKREGGKTDRQTDRQHKRYVSPLLTGVEEGRPRRQGDARDPGDDHGGPAAPLPPLAVEADLPPDADAVVVVQVRDVARRVALPAHREKNRGWNAF